MFESRISAGAIEKLPGWNQIREKNQRGPTTWKDMIENARIGNKKTEQLYRVSHPCLDDHTKSKKGRMGK